jgi:hypothetical protein
MPGLQTCNLPIRPWRNTADQIPEAMHLSAGQRGALEVASLEKDRVELSSRFELQACNFGRTR